MKLSIARFAFAESGYVFRSVPFLSERDFAECVEIDNEWCQSAFRLQNECWDSVKSGLFSACELYFCIVFPFFVGYVLSNFLLLIPLPDSFLYSEWVKQQIWFLTLILFAWSIPSSTISLLKIKTLHNIKENSCFSIDLQQNHLNLMLLKSITNVQSTWTHSHPH